MFLTCCICALVYFSSSLWYDGREVYKKLKSIRTNLANSLNFGGILSDMKRYKEALYSSATNFMVLPVLLYPFQCIYLYKPTPLALEAFNLIRCAFLSKFFYWIWKDLYGVKRRTRFCMELASIDLVSFSSLIIILQLPFYFFSVREQLLMLYMAGTTFFIVRNNIPPRYKDEEGLSPIYSKHTINSIKARLGTRPGGV
jgi:hypothetical protein